MESLRRCTSGENDGVVVGIVTAVAEAENTDPGELTPLNDVIDPDALEQLFSNTDEALCVTFEYRQWLVEVQSRGIVEITGLSDERRRYQCTCHTCEENEVVDELDQAQDYFNEHADRRCEVVLRNVAPGVKPTTPGTAQPDATAEEVQSVDK